MNKRIYLLLFMLLFTLSVTNSVKAQVSGVTRTGQQGTTSETLKFLDLSGNEAWIRPRLARTGENLFYAPLVSTDSSNSIGAVTASIYGNIWHHGWKDITAQGFLVRKGDNNFADGNNDTIYTTASIDDCTNYTRGVPISANLTDLTPNTEYYYCAFAENEKGTSMGDPKTFTTITGVEIEVDVTAPVICSGSSKAVTFTATEMVEISGTTYTWAINPTTGATYTTPIPTGSTFAVTFNPTSTTNYTVSCTSSNGATASKQITVTVNELPTVAFDGSNQDQAFCKGTALTDITLTNTYSTLEPVNLPEGVTLDGTTISGTPTTPGEYKYVIRAISNTDPSCGKDSVKGTITVYVLPTVDVTSSSAAEATVCAGGSAILKATGASTYVWAPAEGLSATTGAEVTATPSDTTKYYVTGTENTHNCSAKDSIVVNVNALPNTELSQATYSVCAGSTVDLSATGADSYSWSVSGGSLSGNTGSPVTYTAPETAGSYTVTVTGMNAQNCEKAATGTITVNALPTVTVSGSDYVCNGSFITLTAAGAASYKWSNDKTTDTIHVYETASYTVEGTDANGCKSTSLAHSVTKESPAVTITDELADKTICKGGNTTLTATTSDVVGSLSYNWNTTPACTTATTGTLSPTTTTDYTVTVTATSANLNTCSVTANKTVTVTVLDPSQYTISAISGTNAICAGETTTLTANPSTTQENYTYTYQWLKGGVAIADATESTFTTPALRSTTTYSVEIKAKVGDCTSEADTSADYPVTVNARPQVTIALTGDVATVTTSESGLSYQWKKGETELVGETGNVLTGCESNSTYTCVVTNSTTGCDTSVSVTTPYIPTSIALSPKSDVKFCYNNGEGTSAATYTADLDDPEHNDEFSYNWYYDGNLVTTPEATAHKNTFTKTYVVGDAGTHTVKVEVVGQTTLNDTYTQTVVVPDPHISAVTITGNTAFCHDGNTTLTASATSDNDGVITYEWSNSLGSNAAATVSAAGTYTVTATSTLNNCTKTATASATVTENNPTAFTVSAITGTNSICKNGTTTLTANPETEESGYTYTYQWYKGNQAIGGATNSTYTTSALTETTTYTVKVKAQRTVDGATCPSSNEEASAPFEVKVTQPITKTISNGTQTVCAGVDITPMVITHNGVLGTPENMPSGVSLSENTISGAPSEAGTFNIRIPMTTSPLTTCGKDTLTAVITVNALPNAPVVEVVGNVATITNPQEGVTYTWDNSTTGTSTTYAAGAAATHTVTAKNNTTGCEKSAAFPVHDIASSISLDNLDIAYCADKLSTDAAKKVFTATPTPPGTYTYTWKVDGNVQASNSNMMTYTFSDATTNTHTISVSVAGANTSGTSNVTVYPLPTITVASGDVSQDICKGAPIANVTFTTNNGTPAIEGTANGLTLNSNVLSGTPTADCDFNIEVSSSQGCTAATQAIQITRKDTATLTVNGDKNRSVCKGSSLTITFNSNAQLSASQIPAGMSFDDNTLSGTPIATGNYTITTANLNSCGTKTITGTVTVKDLPTVSISTTDSKTAICKNENITLTATAGLNSYTWSNAGSSTNTQQVNPQSTTTYTVTVSDGSCTNTASKTITVNELPTVTITGNDEMCAGATGNTLTANVSPTATYNYQWMKGGADITGANNSTLNITESGNYTVAATNTATGCSNTSSAKTVTVQNPTITSVSISAAPGTSICEGSSTTLTASPYGANGAVSYSWSTESSNSSISVNAAGTYSVSATVKIGNCTSSSVSASQAVSVKPNPTVTLSPASQTVCTGKTISPITITPSNATITTVTGYPNGVSFDDINTISGTPLAAGENTVSVTVTSNQGCGTKTETASIKVNPAHTLSDLSSTTRTVCKNSPMTEITFTSSNATVTPSNLPDGVTLTNNGDNYTISGTPTEDGTFNFTVTAASTYDCGEALTKTGTITVNPLPSATISSNTGEFAICNGSNITLSVPNVSGTTYSWSDGTNTNSNNSWQVAPSSTTTYNVTVTKDDCSATSSQVVTVNALPTVTISSSAGDAVCDGATTTLTANASNCTYKWNYNNATTKTIKPTITATATYTVTVTDNNGCTNSTSKEITKKSLPTLTLADISGNTTICNGSNTELTVNHSGDNINTVAYSWTPATGLSAANIKTVTAAPTATTTYTVSVTATSADGCTKSASKSATVTVNSPAVTLNDMQNEAICNGSPITIYAPVASHSDNGQLSYIWSSSPAGVSSTNSSITVTPTATTTYTVEVTDKVGNCTKSASKSKTVTLNPLPTISVSGTKDRSVCVGAAISDITATNLVDGSTVSCTWDPSTPAGISYNSSTKTISGTPSAAGTYTYTLKASISQTPDCDNDGAKVSGAITVKALPDVTSISGNTAFCEGSNTTLSVPTGYSAYLWNNGANTNSITVTEGGNYSVKVTGSNGCVKDVSAVTVTKNSKPTITVSDIALCSGQTATFTATNVTSGATVSWSTTETGCSLSPTTGTTTNLTYPSGAGSYTVTGTATTAAGCASSDNATATITSPNAGTLALSANNTTICNGGSVTLTAAVSGNSGSVQSYKWYKGNDVISGATSNSYTTPTLTESATYKCVATIKDGDCTAETEAKTQTITVLSPAVTSVSIAANPESATVCNGSPVTLTASAEGTGTMSYKWSTNDETAAITVNTAGEYTVTATATSTANGVSCTATTTKSASQTVEAGNPSLNNVLVEAASSKLCPGGSVELYAAAETYQGELSYQWYKGSNAISGATSNSYAATETGNYSCKITANDNGCKVDATSDAVTLTSTNYALTLTGPTSPIYLCGNTNATLVYDALLVDNDNAGAEVPNVTYTWNMGNASEDGRSDTLLKPAGSYTVSVTANIPNCSVQSQNITTVVQSDANAKAAAVRLCENITSLEAKVFEGTTLKTTGYSYAWYAADDLETVLSTDQEYAPSEPGYYTCIATRNIYGCTASATGVVTNHVFTDKPCNIAVPNDNEHLNENGQLMYVTDHENNNYAVVQIGDQCWLRENMRVTTSPKDNAPIRTMQGVQTGESSARYKEQNGNYWYTWTAALDTFRTNTYVFEANAPVLNATEPQRGICPEGWHIPSKEDFMTLVTGRNNGDLSSGCDWQAKNSGTQYGYAGNYNYENRNSTGFSANGIDYWHGSNLQNSTGNGSTALFVTSTEGTGRFAIFGLALKYNGSEYQLSTSANGNASKLSFLSVRCIRGGTVTPAPGTLGVTVDGPDTLYYCTSTDGVSGTYTATVTDAEDDVTYTWKVNPTNGATVTPNGSTCTIAFNTGTDNQRNFVVSCVATSNGSQAGASHSTLVIKTPAPVVGICTGTERDARTAATITELRNVDHIVWVNGNTTITTDATRGYHLIPDGTTIPFGTYTYTAYGPDVNCTSTGSVTIPEPIPTYCSVTNKNSNETVGTGTGDQIEFINDHEGNAYKIMEIGGRCWMRENLKTMSSPAEGHQNYYVPNKQGQYTKTLPECYVYQRGDVWVDTDFPDTNSNKQFFGLLYNWACANGIDQDPSIAQYHIWGRRHVPEIQNVQNVQGMCPDGWHLPTSVEWSTLADSIRAYFHSDYISVRLAGSCAWKAGNATWGAGYYNDPDRRNVLLFTVLPAGDYTGKSSQLASMGAHFWCATQEGPDNGVYFYMNWDNGYFRLATDHRKDIGMSIRCVRND